MNQTIQVDCPQELLLGLHLSREDFSRLLKQQTALMLFKEGRISSGMAARWLQMPRTRFLLLAMEVGAELLEDSEDDFRRETSLL
jgi:predicted HTH domain antitoxin